MIERSIKIRFEYQDIEFPQQVSEESDGVEGIKIIINDAGGNESEIFFANVDQVEEVMVQLYQIKYILQLYNAKKSTEPTEA